jgi:hypothetical protein
VLLTHPNRRRSRIYQLLGTVKLMSRLTDNDRERLQKAVQTGKTEPVFLLLDELKENKDPDVINAPLNQNGSTCLIFANSHADLTNALINVGAEVNVGNKFGKTPLMYAAQGGHTEVAKVLLGKGADILLKDKDEETALSFAVSNNRIDVAILLVQNGADPYAKRPYTQCAIDKVHDLNKKEQMKLAREAWLSAQEQSQGKGKRKERGDDDGDVPVLVPLSISCSENVVITAGSGTGAGQAGRQATDHGITTSTTHLGLGERDRKDLLETKVAVGALRQELSQLRLDVRSISLSQEALARDVKQAFYGLESKLDSLYSAVVDGQRAVHSSIIDLSKAEQTPGMSVTTSAALGTAMMIKAQTGAGVFKIDTANEEVSMYE